jgi:hypothetical protein
MLWELVERLWMPVVLTVAVGRKSAEFGAWRRE